MFRQSLRSIARTARTGTIGVRTYAEAVNPDVLKVSLVSPHQAIFTNKEVSQVNLPASSGEMGVLANHVPTVEELAPGVVEVIESSGTSSKYFVSGGFASIVPGSKLSISTVEAHPLDAFSSENIKSLLAEAQKNASSADETVAAEAAIEIEVLEALQAAVH
ncbi:F0F1-type ATP synthase, epsilon subunit (mitochondrial delta subunit) [Ogataea parapolymorpha DL-1]|uniref:ATP synthase subunit delta, mitochondrial n=1 Tax=Ogataea parapolymorpha (strain ATCC 26012 / BCRC 20466 / JCM 22074 / NRRL Y-7560 / DL-1) TaxID=871575 RepID=W1QBD1_OGAPD|nr:F0F1-type ATP synthase, epsilon subunit (mitochondrial delta subunit) [Ogataea parapolymorpha DL-1]ESW97704.1 F0F1-type ATP synthase, epsilon subunit (mitochondrial delta subunit) [Ogataea parapolymorpha DL-1]